MNNTTIKRLELNYIDITGRVSKNAKKLDLLFDRFGLTRIEIHILLCFLFGYINIIDWLINIISSALMRT